MATPVKARRERRDLRSTDRRGYPHGAVWDITYIQIVSGVWVAVAWEIVQ
jgi:hypothetical protein